MKRESNVTILVHEDDSTYRECYMYMDFLPRSGEKMSIVPHRESIEHYEVINVEHNIFRKFKDGWMNYDYMPTINVRKIND